MKRLIALAALAPGASLAHGGHAPLPEAAHAASHGTANGLALAVVALAAAALLALWRARDEG
jgi:hypothetical protein